MSRRVSTRGQFVLVCLLAGVLVGVAACGRGTTSRPIPPVTTIQGKITGEQASAKLKGTERLVGVASARLTCNGQATTTALDGSYFLIVQPANSYQCFVEVNPTYQRASVTLPGGAGQRLTLNFTTTATLGGCSAAKPVNGLLECGGLALQAGSLAGKVTYPSGRAVGGAGVQCSNLHNHSAPLLTGATDSQGGYQFSPVPVGTYWCVAMLNESGAAQAQQVGVLPAASAALNFQLCQSSCPRVGYHGGAVIHHLHAYLIFWLPSSYHFDPDHGDDAYQGLIARFISGLGGTPFYGLLSQYFDVWGPVGNDVTLAGTYVDTTPYQHCASITATCTPAAASVSDPLYDHDIYAEVSRVVVAKHWVENDDAEFFVFTGVGAHACIDTGSDSPCTFAKHNQGVCGWHSAFYDSASATDATIYAFLPDPLTSPSLCVYGEGSPATRTGVTPNSNRAADALMTSLSHELFESVSDPLNTSDLSWIQQPEPSGGGEIADICASVYGPLQGDGANVVLRNGGRFIVQAEWSNVAGTCALS